MGSKLGSITFFFISHLIDTIFDKFFLFVYSTRNLKKDQICKSGPFINAYATFFPAVNIATFVYGFDDEICLLSEQDYQDYHAYQDIEYNRENLEKLKELIENDKMWNE